MSILIITGGEIDENFALSFLREKNFEHIIVVDGALSFWDKVEADAHISAKFDHLVGDFDTVSPSILKKYMKKGDVTVHQFNPEKDYTDTDIALKLALELEQKDRDKKGNNEKDEKNGEQGEIVLLGATGSRADHMLANLQLLEQARAAGIPAVIVDSHNRIRLVEGDYCLERSAQFGRYISLIPVTEILKDVTLKGFKYPLDKYTVHLGESICVSNELAAERGEIIIGGGKAFLIESRD